MKVKTNVQAGVMNVGVLNQNNAQAATYGGGGGVIQQNVPAGTVVVF